MRSQKLILMLIVLIGYPIPVYRLGAQPRTVGQEKVGRILGECAAYCEKLNNLVLYFVCREEITERIDNTDPKALGQFSSGDPKRILKKPQFPVFEKSVYIYDYQLIRKHNVMKEQRILLEENGEKKNEQNAPLKTRRFKHTNMVFGPIGLLSEQNQPFFDYAIIKQTELNDEEVVILEATPKSDASSNKLFGKIWIKTSDYSILKIEWKQTALGNYEEIEKIASHLNAIPKITLITEYGFEKNEIRFPSKYSLEEEYLRQEGGSYKKSEVIVLYKDYKFFTVETEVRH